MEYKWKQTIFTPECLDGAGQYIVREHRNKLVTPHFTDTTSLQCNMYKVGYIIGGPLRSVFSNQYLITAISDGMTNTGYFISKDKDGNKIEDSSKWEWISFSGEDNMTAKQVICDYLNNNIHGETYRFATNEELVRVALQQKWRTKG